MAGKGVSYIKWKKSSGRCFMTALSSALLEWLLIVMLLMNGVFAYLITWFARYCELPIPCLLCSRLDHAFDSQRVGSYWDLMCKSHKSEISSLVLCTLHDKLVDVHGMCESCLFSFATKDKSNPQTYRLLVGKLGLDPDNDVDDSPLLGDKKPHSTNLCCCCNEPWSSRSHAQVLLKTKSIELERGGADAPLTREFRLNWNSSNKENKRSILHESFEDCSPHFGYSELKLNSDTESEDQTCEMEKPRGTVSDTSHFQKHLMMDSLQTEPLEVTAQEKPKVLNVSLPSPNLIDHEQPQSDLIKSHVTGSTLLEHPNWINDWMKPPQDTVPEKPLAPDASVLQRPNLIEHELNHSDLIESKEAPSKLAAPVGHGLEELNWQDIDLKTESFPAIYPINTDNVPESPIAADIQVDPSKIKCSDQKDTKTSLEVEQTPRPENIERTNEAEKEHAPTDVPDSKISNDVNDGGVQPTNNLDLGDAYKLAVRSRGRQLSGKTLEHLFGKDSTRVSEDLKLLLSQLSMARGLELPLQGMLTPRISGNLEDARSLDSLTSIGMQILQKRFSLERNDSRNSLERNGSGFESLDVSTVSEVDGESEVDRLKRQIEHDKRFMNALYKELEEERNASAVAANQALAMITRLQEEKAALQMEALHDIRMMEEQAEYDVEELERMNELLVEKEREIQDLEAELDYYRIKYPDDEMMLVNEEAVLDLNHGEEPTSMANIVKEKLDSSGNKDAFSLGRKSSSPKSSWLGFEDERLYISHRLSNLEKKLHLFSNSGIYQDLQNGNCFNVEEEKQAGSKLESEKYDDILQTSNSTSFGVRRTFVRRAHSLKTPKSVGQDSSEVDAVSLGYEVSTLNERLQALEADRNFLEHAINSLRNGEDGVRFIRDIASHLQELRKVGIKRKQSLA